MGQSDFGKVQKFLTVAAAFRERGCLEWPFTKNHGYGICWYRNKGCRSDQVIYHLFTGEPYSNENIIEKTCNNVSCCNPLHMTCTGTRCKYVMKVKTAPGIAGEFFEEGFKKETDQCIEWPFNTDKKGYGRLTIGERSIRVHRLACERRWGPAPPDKPEAAHSCGNASCFNKYHLRWASSKENARDRKLHGRNNGGRGESNWNSKLKVTQILEIRALHGQGATLEELSQNFQVKPQTIWRIVTRRSWRHV